MKRRHILSIIGVAGVGIVILALFVRPWYFRPIYDETCQSNLKSIALALHSYHQRFGSFPPAYVLDAHGDRAHSWRVLLLPYLDNQELYDSYRFDEPWNGPNNTKLARRMPAVYACPADWKRAPTTTNYLAIVSSVSAWPEHHAACFDDFQDGISDTILLVESCDSAVHWMEPRDLGLGDAMHGVNPDASPSFSSFHGAHANYAKADGKVGSAVNDADEDVLFAALTRNSGLPYGDLPPPPELAAVIGEFVPIVDADKLIATDVQPVLSLPLRGGAKLRLLCDFSIGMGRRQTVVRWEKDPVRK